MNESYRHDVAICVYGSLPNNLGDLERVDNYLCKLISTAGIKNPEFEVAKEKVVVSEVNVLGHKVASDAKGLIIQLFSDGTSRKIYR